MSPSSSAQRHLAHATSNHRGDIQSLRALAVSLVLINHLWPNRLSGGFVGVDVFFVISGYLITSHLIRKPPRDWKSLGEFWARRVKRLLPAATLVLVSTLIGVILLAPSTVLEATLKEIIAAALYFENWILAGQATDYFAADQLASPVQHYWSLSVEEQFYIFWPLVAFASLTFAGYKRGKNVFGVAMLAVFLSSLAASIVLTATSPQSSYFVTHTRMWELALGGILAFLIAGQSQPVLTPNHWLRPLAAWAATLTIMWSAWSFSPSTVFPGAAALLPTAAAALFIAAADHSSTWGPDRIASRLGAHELGRVSYSVYLWHWPLIVLTGYWVARPLDWSLKLFVLALTVVLAELTTRFVEDPIRSSHRFRRPRHSFILGIALMATVASCGMIVLNYQQSVQARQELAATSLANSNDPCLGARSVNNASCSQSSELLTPAAFAADDMPRVYEDDCWNRRPFTSRKTCSYGPKDAKGTIALIGNSHAGHWEPAFAEWAASQGWRVKTFLISECWIGDVRQVFDIDTHSTNCQKWVRWAVDETSSEEFDVIVTSNRTWRKIEEVPAADQAAEATKAYRKTLEKWVASGKKTLVIRDNPQLPERAPDCVAEHPDDYREVCSWPSETVVSPDPLARAARSISSKNVSVVDFTDVYCPDGHCPAVIGEVIVYFDQGHLTRTFSATLGDRLQNELAPLLRLPES